MTEKDLDIAIEKCERIMEFDTRTLQNPESEDGWIFNKVYDLLKFLRECQFDTDAKGDMNDLISRQAAITEFSRCELTPDGGIDANYAIDFLKQMPPAQPKWIPCTPETMPEREGRYVCTYTYDGKKDVFMFRFENGDFLVPWYVDAITAWYKPLDPWEGERYDTTESQ